MRESRTRKGQYRVDPSGTVDDTKAGRTGTRCLRQSRPETKTLPKPAEGRILHERRVTTGIHAENYRGDPAANQPETEP